mmetsp:Transcript_76236/g.181341  ORF Transcript_76236/g.181341 Transcript_76236/m.181341 type:complete len:158 (-) Transcript_76236:186-659(-)
MEADGARRGQVNGAPPRGGGTLYVLELPKIPGDTHIYLKIGSTWQPPQARLTKLKSEISNDQKGNFSNTAVPGWHFRKTGLSLFLADVQMAENIVKDINARKTVPHLFSKGFSYVNEIFNFVAESDVQPWLREVNDILERCMVFGDTLRAKLAGSDG